ncbi:hypothetical protein STEG23_022664 [Scotinomys teguina]
MAASAGVEEGSPKLNSNDNNSGNDAIVIIVMLIVGIMVVMMIMMMMVVIMMMVKVVILVMVVIVVMIMNGDCDGYDNGNYECDIGNKSISDDDGDVDCDEKYGEENDFLLDIRKLCQVDFLYCSIIKYI